MQMVRTRSVDGLGRKLRPRNARGMAALTVVMGIFFVMALMAAYTNRNMLFEQRTSANTYRAERAINAADAATDWTVAMLNAGRITDECVASTAATDLDFRSRYLTLDPTSGGYASVSQIVPAGTDEFYPGCLIAQGTSPSLSCACPSTSNKTASLTAPGGYAASAFRVSFATVSGQAYTPPGTLILQVRGCSNSGSGSTSCQSKQEMPSVDAVSLVRAYIGLVRALPAAPIAALTAGTTASSPSAALTIANTDPATGVTVHVGQDKALPTSTYQTPAGMPGDGQLIDGQLLSTANGGRFFETVFGMSETLYKAQPAAVRITCPSAGCTLTNLEAANWITAYPGRTIVVDGNLALDTAPTNTTIGSAASPLMLVVLGDLTWSTRLNLTGFVYARNITVSGSASGSTVQGSVLSAQTFNSSVPITLSYDAAVLNLIAKSYGSFVRVPGGWNRGA